MDPEIRNIELKINKLLDLYLEDKVDKITYEENNIKDSLTFFRKLFENKEPLTEFGGEVFKKVVEEVIIGGYKED